MYRLSHHQLAERLSLLCRERLSSLGHEETERLVGFIHRLIDGGMHPPRRGKATDWRAVSELTQINLDALRAAKADVQIAFDALVRAFPGSQPLKIVPRSSVPKRRASGDGTEKPSQPRKGLVQKRGPKPRPIVEFPTALMDDRNVAAFADALAFQMERHGESAYALHRALVAFGASGLEYSTIRSWRNGTREPRTDESHAHLTGIARRYRLADDYFISRLGHGARAVGRRPIALLNRSRQRRLAWHLPSDFSARPLAEQAEIIEWVETVIVAGSTEYRRYQSEAARHRFGLRFPAVMRGRHAKRPDRDSVSPLKAPPLLTAELAALLEFKTSALTPLGYQRSGRWGSETAAQKVEHLSLLFGAFAAGPDTEIRGLGLPRDALCMAMLGSPSTWDWYLRWRHQKRGFYTAWEIDMLMVAMSLTRKETGWLRQSPGLSDRLSPMPGLITESEVVRLQSDWNGACDALFAYAHAAAKEIKAVARVHRDPFEPIMPVLEADSPVAEYRKITDEVLRLMPDQRRYPKAAAESVRTFLMLRLGLHLGVRQKNLRQLMVTPKGDTPRTERALADLKRGELRWSTRDEAWEVVIPAVAFKNAHSSFFAGKPFRLLLPDLGDLYKHIDDYLSRHREVLLAHAADPGTLFVKSVNSRSRDPSYDQSSFYEAWRLAIQRYGVFNPYTGRGAIKGILPHGPHSVRDVLATHVLKRTGSYQQASYAIQDTPEMVAKHYARFLPEDKAAMAAQILNQVWAA